MQDRLHKLIEPLARDLGYELLLVELAGGDHRQIVRLYIDSASGITLEDCERVSREVSALFDVEDPIPGEYTLEVSSPGLDRPLVTADHFRQFLGEDVRVKTLVPLEGRRRFKGRLDACDGDEIEMTVDGQPYRLPISEIEMARLVPEV